MLCSVGCHLVTKVSGQPIGPLKTEHVGCPETPLTNYHSTLCNIQEKEDLINMRGARGGVVVKALHYKLVGRGFDSRWCHWNFSVT